MLGARERALARERELYEQLLTRLIEALPPLQTSADAMAELDALAALAQRAVTLGWSEPTLIAEPRLLIEAARHPVVEALHRGAVRAQRSGACMSSRRMLIITGPNMGGKSTYMRSVALVVVLAHLGSFVPAARAEIGPIDRIFTRIGAADDLAGGRSTFMVEMTETANILHNASAHSLVLMDEIGRGTSTFDGLSLATRWRGTWPHALRACTLFATHYFELTALAQEVDGCANVHLDATEHGDSLVFLHAVKEGPANRSFGLQVAQLAGVPREVIGQARHYMAQLEAQRPQADLFAVPATPAIKHEAHDTKLRARLSDVDPDQLSPRAALDLLYELQRLARDQT